MVDCVTRVTPVSRDARDEGTPQPVAARKRTAPARDDVRDGGDACVPGTCAPFKAPVRRGLSPFYLSASTPPPRFGSFAASPR